MAIPSIKNLNDSSPAAASGYQTGKWQQGSSSGTDPTYDVPVFPVTVEVPNDGGVTKLTAGATAAAGDCGKLLSFTLSGAATYTLPATAPSVPDGGGTNRWKVKVQNVSASTAALTIAATSPAKLDGVTAGSLALGAGSGVDLYTDGTDYFTERGNAPSSINFADDETVGGSGTLWTLAHTPNPAGSLILVQHIPNFGGIVLIAGTDCTLAGASITTTNSLSSGVLTAWYRY